jgi:hypothetical protein
LICGYHVCIARSVGGRVHPWGDVFYFAVWHYKPELCNEHVLERLELCQQLAMQVIPQIARQLQILGRLAQPLPDDTLWRLALRGRHPPLAFLGFGEGQALQRSIGIRATLGKARHPFR